MRRQGGFDSHPIHESNQVKNTITSNTYVGIALASWDEVKRANGITASPVTSPDQEPVAGYPKLSNGEMIALIQAWKRAAARSKVPTWGGWYELTLDALGWQKPGDRFKDSRADAQAPVDDATVRVFWTSIAQLAGQLDATHTVLRPLYIDWSYPGFEAAAREAWRKMQEEGGSASAGPAPTSTEAAAASGGNGLLIVLLLAAWATSRRKKG